MKGDEKEKVFGTVFHMLERHFEGCLLECQWAEKAQSPNSEEPRTQWIEHLDGRRFVIAVIRNLQFIHTASSLSLIPLSSCAPYEGFCVTLMLCG